MQGHCLMIRTSNPRRTDIFGIAVVFFCFLWAVVLASFSATSSIALAEEGSGVMGSMPGSPDGSSSWWGDLDLDEAAARLASALVRQGNLRDQPVLISLHDLFDAQTGLSLPMASQLRGKLITEMKRQGVRVLLPGGDEERCMILQGTWQKQGEDLAIDLKILKLGSYGPEAVASASEKVPVEKIESGVLVPDRESWARYLVRKLEQNTDLGHTRKVHMRDFKVRARTCSPELGPYLKGWLRPALAESRMFVLLDPQKELRGLAVSDLRVRGTRAIRPTVGKVVAETSLTADLLNADGELKGEVWVHQGKIEVRAMVIGREGRQVTAASADIPSGLFPQDLLKPSPEPVMPARPVEEACTGCISKEGLRLELTTTRGEGRPVYHKNEHIRFLIRLNRSAWVYLFDLDTKGNATLLYPVDKNGHLARGGHCGALPEPGQPLVLPEDGCAYDLVVDEPYGTDRVWAVAAESALHFPADLTGDWKKADLLVKRIRDQGLSRKSKYAEAEIELLTGP